MFSLAGCTFFAPTPDPDDNTGGDDPIVTPEPDDPTPGPDDPNVPDDIGDNSWADWEDVFTGGSTEAYRLYQEAKEDGYVSTIFGRRRYLNDIASHNAVARGLAERNEEIVEVLMRDGATDDDIYAPGD